MKRIFTLFSAILIFTAAVACSVPEPTASMEATDLPAVTQAASAEETVAPLPTDQPLPFSVASAGIKDGVIGDAYGARAEQLANGVPTRSIPLTFTGIPDGTACLTLSMTDPDGGDWVHWLAVNLPAADLLENASIDQAGEMVQGKNDFGFTGYGGPTPPSGTHTYIVTVYALAEPVALEKGFSLQEFEQAIDGKVLAEAELTGDYSH